MCGCEVVHVEATCENDKMDAMCAREMQGSKVVREGTMRLDGSRCRVVIEYRTTGPSGNEAIQVEHND